MVIVDKMGLFCQGDVGRCFYDDGCLIDSGSCWVMVCVMVLLYVAVAGFDHESRILIIESIVKSIGYLMS